MTIKIVEIYGYGRVSQRTEYQGTQEELIESGIAAGHMFDVGKSGTRRSTRSQDITQHFMTERKGKGLWRITRSHPPGNPPYIDNNDHFVGYLDKFEGKYRKIFVHAHTVYLGQVKADSRKTATCYTGTKRQLICAGLAVPEMFPKKAAQARPRKWSSPEQGDWLVSFVGAQGESSLHPLSLWVIYYYHNPITLPKELQRERDAYIAFKRLRQQFRDDDGAYC